MKTAIRIPLWPIIDLLLTALSLTLLLDATHASGSVAALAVIALGALGGGIAALSVTRR